MTLFISHFVFRVIKKLRRQRRLPVQMFLCLFKLKLSHSALNPVEPCQVECDVIRKPQFRG